MLRYSVVLGVGTRSLTRRLLRGGGPSLSEFMVEASSGDGDPVCDESCDGGGVGNCVLVLLALSTLLVVVVVQSVMSASGVDNLLGTELKSDVSDK